MSKHRLAFIALCAFAALFALAPEAFARAAEPTLNINLGTGEADRARAPAVALIRC